jgi:atypical dual specificity phosphatase
MRWLIARILFYPTLAWNLFLHRVLPHRRWWDRVDEHVLTGALPFATDAHALHAEGVRAVVNTCEEYAGPEEAYRELGITQLRIPTVDFRPPSLPDIERAVDFMRECVASGKQVYVHCKAGRGRSATVVLCWLIKQKGMTPEDGQALLLKCRPHVNRRLFKREAVQAFAERAKK